MVALIAASMLAIRRLYPPDLAFARIGLDLALQVAFVLGALRLTGRPERFRQTFTALCGTGALLVLLTWPLLDVLLEREPGEDLFALAMLALFAVYGWSVVVVGHILRHALDLGLGRAVLLALAYILASTLVADTIVPAPSLEAP
ncbi:MAG: hypothetical protein U5K43_02645 [Halofilum sp. (in: g-proteobacteria)]|nr:hypothetical protein [Halofilum sp. (in: g-proteobacteria)]